MIFSLLNVRKKTAATLAGIAIGALCLWGVSMWQNISLQELFNILIGIVLLIGAVMLAALLVITAFKLLQRLIGKAVDSGAAKESESDSGQR